MLKMISGLFTIFLWLVIPHCKSQPHGLESMMDWGLHNIEKAFAPFMADIYARMAQKTGLQSLGLMGHGPITYGIGNMTRERYDHGELCEEYDFIIIGAGSSGSVIASRLSEVSGWKILLIEAGDGENLYTDIPLLAAELQSSLYNWGHQMEQQPGACLGMIDQRCNWPRGKVVGGCSVINYMIYNRGNRLDYDRLADAGNPGWCYDDVMPYFKKSERANLKMYEPDYHGFEGPLSVEDVPYRTPIVSKFLKGATERGHVITDYSGENQMGFNYVQATTINGHRCSTAKAYLKKEKHRKNLHILTNAHATKIIINPDTKCAEGVEYYMKGNYHTVRTKKEVIVSAGTFHSPQLLMLSGVGPKKHLQEMNIPVLKDLAVGESLYDHVCFPGLVFTVNISHATLSPQECLTPVSIKNWFEGHGPMTSIGSVEALGFIKTCKSQDPEEVPDIEFMFMGGTMASDFGVGGRKAMGITPEVYNTFYRPFEKLQSWTVFPVLMHPQSRGYMKLKSKDPLALPLLYGNYFTDPDNKDIDTIVESIKEIIKITETPAMQSIGTTLSHIPTPGCEHLEFGCDEYWRCAIRHLASTIYHQIGTCKMGPKDDREAVVNHELRVYGIKKLRVADCSIIPVELTAHTNAPAIMIGEKLSDLLKYEWAALN